LWDPDAIVAPLQRVCELYPPEPIRRAMDDGVTGLGSLADFVDETGRLLNA
jgi:hypothetical protein